MSWREAALSAPDVLDKVQGAGEASLNHLKGVLTLWRVSSESQDVLDAIALHLQCASEDINRCLCMLNYILNRTPEVAGSQLHREAAPDTAIGDPSSSHTERRWKSLPR